MVSLVREWQKTAGHGDISRTDADDLDRSKAAESHLDPEADTTDSRGQVQELPEGPRHRRLRLVGRWGANILIVGVLAATMAIWLIFLAWAGGRLLALLL